MANARKSKVRFAVEHVFAYQKGRYSRTNAAVRLARRAKCALSAEAVEIGFLEVSACLRIKSLS
jgi:hypothetical protein